MAFTVRPTRADKKVARLISRITTRRTEEAAEILTLGADGRILRAAAAAWWLYCRGKPAPQTKSGRPYPRHDHRGARSCSSAQVSAGVVLTRVVLLAHCASDVAAGLFVGDVLERVIRLFTGYRGSDGS
jgi:hypothetical protein